MEQYKTITGTGMSAYAAASDLTRNVQREMSAGGWQPWETPVVVMDPVTRNVTLIQAMISQEPLPTSNPL